MDKLLHRARGVCPLESSPCNGELSAF